MLKTLGKFLVAMVMMGIGTSSLAEKPVTLMVSTSPPYSDRQLPNEGLALEIVKHVFQKAGYSPEINFENWPRAMEGVSVGLYDALAAAWYSDSRAEEYLYSEPYLTSELILLTLRSHRYHYSDMSQLVGRRLGTQVDFAYGVDFDQIPNLKLVPENHAIQNLLGLLNGSVDAVIGDQRTLAMQIHTYLPNDIQKFRVARVKLPSRARHIAASKAIEGEEKLVADFNRALATARKDGSFKAIVDKWDKLYPID